MFKLGRKRARDGHQFLSSSTRRKIRKRSGLSARQYKTVTKNHRRHKRHGWEPKSQPR